jgi:hypothetical protein
MPHPDKPLEHITLGDLAVNSIDNAVEDMDLQGQSYLTFSLIAKPLGPIWCFQASQDS